jgi:hypothetical protein
LKTRFLANYSFCSVLRQAHNFFQSELLTECEKVLLLSVFSNPYFPLKSSKSCLRLLPRLPVISKIPSIFLSRTCFSSQFLRKMWQIHLALFFIFFMIFLHSLTLVTYLKRSFYVTVQTLLFLNIKVFFNHPLKQLPFTLESKWNSYLVHRVDEMLNS